MDDSVVDNGVVFISAIASVLVSSDDADAVVLPSCIVGCVVVASPVVVVGCVAAASSVITFEPVESVTSCTADASKNGGTAVNMLPEAVILLL